MIVTNLSKKSIGLKYPEMTNKFNTRKQIEMSGTENKENYEVENKRNKGSGSGVSSFMSKLSINEERIKRRHMSIEEREIRTVYKYQRSIENHNTKIDREGGYDESKTPFRTRCKLVDFILGVQDDLNICDDTIYVFMNILDKFIQKHRCMNKDYKKVAVAALVIAQKYEEVDWPDIRCILNRMEEEETQMTEKDVMDAEKQILISLNYEIEFVNPLYFLRKANKANGYESKTRNMAKYILETMHMHSNTYGYSNRIKAATAVFIARRFCSQDTNRNLFWLYCGTERHEIVDCYHDTIRALKQKKYVNLEKKYASESRSHINKTVDEIVKANF